MPSFAAGGFWLRAEDKSFLDGVAAGVYSVPGDPEGSIDFQAITDKLKAIERSGWIVVTTTPSWDTSTLPKSVAVPA